MHTMDNIGRQLIRNISRLIERLQPGDTISRHDLIDALSRPLPAPHLREDDATLYQMFRHYIARQTVSSAPLVVSYAEAAKVSDKTESAVRMAVSRRSVLATTLRRSGHKTRRGVYFDSLADWCGWSPEERQSAVNILRDTASSGTEVNKGNIEKS